MGAAFTKLTSPSFSLHKRSSVLFSSLLSRLEQVFSGLLWFPWRYICNTEKNANQSIEGSSDNKMTICLLFTSLASFNIFRHAAFMLKDECCMAEVFSVLLCLYPYFVALPEVSAMVFSPLLKGFFFFNMASFTSIKLRVLGQRGSLTTQIEKPTEAMWLGFLAV